MVALVRWSMPLNFLVLATSASGVLAQGYSAVPRWGQAAAIINQTLFLSGGKTDPQHQFTYASAPNSNDLLSLDLSASFALSSPPWSYVSGSQIPSTSQGPAVSFHTLTPYTYSDLLLFGGDAGFSMIETKPDSAWLLNVRNISTPSWSSQAAGWASEPLRRVYHASASASGAIYILGGQKADGSQIDFPDSYIFNAVGDNGSPAFVPLSSSANAPAGLFGQAAHVLPGGMLLSFGGFFSSGSTSSIPSPLSIIYILDTTSASPTWSIHNATGGTIPSPRRDFASALLANGKIIIHGGSDATMQTLYSDGALLDTTQTPMTWTHLDVLSDTLGRRASHFAVPVQNQVMFGFGWTGDAPANASLALYDVASDSFQLTFTPPPVPISVTTLPVVPTAPGGTYPTSGGNSGSGKPESPSHSGKASSPTSSPGNGQGGGDGGEGIAGSKGAKSSTMGVVIGAVFGSFALAGLVGSGVYYTLRQRGRGTWMGGDATKLGRWRLMPEEDPWDTGLDESPTQPGKTVQMAGTGWHGQPRRGWGILGIGAFIGAGGTHGTTGRRRLDMLADEDARQYDMVSVFHDDENDIWGYEHYKSHRGKRRKGTAGSSISNGTEPSLWNLVWNASVSSLRNVGASLGVTAASVAAARDGDDRARNAQALEWSEKDELSLDPFRDPVENPVGIGSDSMVTGMGTGVLPIDSDHIATSRISKQYPTYSVEGTEDMVNADGQDTTSLLSDFHEEGIIRNVGGGGELSRTSLSRSSAMTGLARAETASPSPSELAGGTSVESHDASSSRATQSSSNLGTGITSSSADHSSSINSPTSPRTTSIIGVVSAPSAAIRRSDSWWSRFSRTPFLDRHSNYDPSHLVSNGGLAEFRDPNPAPRLGPIQESPHLSPESTLAASPPTTAARGSARKETSGYAASTKSSIKTADSELIERMDGRMEVVQRALSLTSRDTASPTATIDSQEDCDTHNSELPFLEASGFDLGQPWTASSGGEAQSLLTESPTEESVSDSNLSSTKGTRVGLPSHFPLQSYVSSLTSADSSASQRTGPLPPRRTLTGTVAARVTAYERRMSEDGLARSGPRASLYSKSRNDGEEDHNRRGGVGYGLVPKSSLFVANPDRRKSSGGSG